MMTAAPAPAPAAADARPKTPPGFVDIWIRKRPYTPILFVMITLILWYVFQFMTRIVITCLPGGDACILGWAPWPLHMLFWPVSQPSQFLYGTGWLDAAVSLVTLLLALWPAIRIFFPPEQL